MYDLVEAGRLVAIKTEINTLESLTSFRQGGERRLKTV